jgi:NAD+ kinase
MELKAVGIISKPKKDDVCSVAPQLLEWLEKHSIQPIIDQETASCLGRDDGLPRKEIPERVELLVVLGGDGTLLAAVRLVDEHRVPILGVNLGYLGFLTEITVDEVCQVLEDILGDRHQLSRRTMLESELTRGGKHVASYDSLNDVVLHKAALARIIDLDVSVDGKFVSHIRADGLIIGSPTGSTAYSLAVGGPIVLPSVDAMLVTPIAPHMLTNRPLVIPGDCLIEVQVGNVHEEEAVYITVDGQVGEEIRQGDRLRVRRSNRYVDLVVSPHRDFFQVLRSKLRWGER